MVIIYVVYLKGYGLYRVPFYIYSYDKKHRIGLN